MPKYFTTTAQFNPFTLDELSKIAEGATKAQVQVEEDYANMESKLSAFNYLKDSNIEDDKKYYNDKILPFINKLEEQRDDLMTTGVNHNAAKDLYNMNKTYTSTLAPVVEAISAKQNIIKEANQLALSGRNVIYTRDPYQISIKELMENGEGIVPTSVDLDSVTQSTAAMASPLSTTDRGLVTSKGEEFTTFTRKTGYTSNEIIEAIKGNSKDEALNTIIDTIKKKFNYNSFDEDNRTKFINAIYNGLNNAIGRDSTSMMRNPVKSNNTSGVERQSPHPKGFFNPEESASPRYDREVSKKVEKVSKLLDTEIIASLGLSKDGNIKDTKVKKILKELEEEEESGFIREDGETDKDYLNRLIKEDKLNTGVLNKTYYANNDDMKSFILSNSDKLYEVNKRGKKPLNKVDEQLRAAIKEDGTNITYNPKNPTEISISVLNESGKREQYIFDASGFSSYAFASAKQTEASAQEARELGEYLLGYQYDIETLDNLFTAWFSMVPSDVTAEDNKIRGTGYYGGNTQEQEYESIIFEDNE